MRHVSVLDVGEIGAEFRAKPPPRWPGRFPPHWWTELSFSLRHLLGVAWKRGPNGEPRWLSILYATACGIRVKREDVCREIHRRLYPQLAPLPDFCNPTCPTCLVILDLVAEAKPPEAFDPIEFVRAKPRSVQQLRIDRGLLRASRRT